MPRHWPRTPVISPQLEENNETARSKPKIKRKIFCIDAPFHDPTAIDF